MMDSSDDKQKNKKKTPGITTGNEPIDLDGFSDNAIVRIHLRGETQQTNGKIVELTVGKLRKLLDEKFILSSSVHFSPLVLPTASVSLSKLPNLVK